jgi:hypothetical protein
MRTIGIWASGVLASAIPFIFVGVVLAFSNCVFDAQGEHAPLAPSRESFQEEASPPEQAASFQEEAAPPEQATSFKSEQTFAVPTANAPDDVAPRQPDERARGDADAGRHHDTPPERRSRFHSRVRYSPFEFVFRRLRVAFTSKINCSQCWRW